MEYNEKLYPIVRMDSIRLVLAIVASNKWEVHHINVKSAFPHGDLEEEIYMRQPEGYTEYSSFVCKLGNYLYGIKQAPRAWYAKMDSFLLAWYAKKSERCKFDCNVYMEHNGGFLLLIVLYVDDLLITGGRSSHP